MKKNAMNQTKDTVESSANKLGTSDERYQWYMVESKKYYYRILIKNEHEHNSKSPGVEPRKKFNTLQYQKKLRLKLKAK